jgi:glutamate carboxypeptidase
MDLDLTGNLVSYLSDHLQEMVDLLAELVLAESPSTVAQSQERVLGILATRLRDLSYSAWRIPGRQSGGHLFARPRRRVRRRPTQLLLGHCDTVWPLGTLADMPLVVDEGVLRGPGAFDMKAGLVQMVYALQALHALASEPPLSPLVLINSDEEIGSRESTPYIRRLARVAERAFVMEPALGLDGKLKTARKGVGRFTITVKGKAAHAGLNPEAGASAILELSYVIQKLFALNDPERGITVNVGMIDGGLGSNVIAPESRAMVDVRVVTKEDARQIEQAVLGLQPTTPGVRLEIEGRVARPPMERTERNLALWHTAKELGRQLGLELKDGLAGGGSDGNTTSLYTATLDGLGAVGDGAHAGHEFVYFDKMVERSALLALLIMAPSVRQSHPQGPALLEPSS